MSAPRDRAKDYAARAERRAGLRAYREEELLTLKEFAALFGRNEKAVSAKARIGWDAATKIGGQWYVRVAKRDADAARNRPTAM